VRRELWEIGKGALPPSFEPRYPYGNGLSRPAP